MKRESEKDKKTAVSFSGFIKYREDKMTPRERNAFERQLQSDPFKEEAMEGFESVTADEARHDMKLLRKWLGSESAGRRYIYYYAAASIALIAVLSTVVILITRDNPSMLLSDNNTIKETIEIARPGIITKSIPSEERTSPVMAGAKSPQIVAETAAPETSVPASAKESEMKRLVTDNAMVQDPQAFQQASPDTEVAKDSRKITPMALRVKADAEFVALHDTTAPLKDEEVLVEYGKSLRTLDPEATSVRYTPPEPVRGMTEFNKYLEENIKRPEEDPGGQRVVVVAGFVVDRNGTIDTIKIIRSPSDTYSEEAVRLIKEGPQWKPATENGIRIDEEVRIRIVFR